MHKVNVDDMFSGKRSRYALVIAVAKRAREISDDFQEQHIVSDDKPVLLAIDEFKEHKFNILEPEDEEE